MPKYNRYKSNNQLSLFGESDDEDLVVNVPAHKSEQPVPDEQAPTIALSQDQAERAVLRFISFGSGSSGNCAYVGNDQGGILIDAGVEPKKVFDALSTYGIKPAEVKGIIITHDHGDHVRYAYNIVRKHRHIHVYCTNRALNGMLRRHNISRNIKDRHVAIYKEIPFNIAGMQITAFEVPHDGTDNAGFFIEYGERQLCVATDIGHITERARFYLSKAHYLMLESNYDADMLASGSYPEFLKNRIVAENGHLDNVDAARFVAEIYRPELKYVFLCHLSQDNNTPEIAREAMCSELKKIGVEAGFGNDTIADKACPVQIVPLPRFVASRCYMLRD